MEKKRFKLGVSRSISNHHFSKKGQITVFIILGIILLLILILIISMKKEVIVFKPDEIIPTEKGKVENFIVTCMDQIGEEALFKVGLQSGYIEVPEHIKNDGTLHLKISPMNVVPYWAYGPETDIPPLQEIKQDLDVYMEENLKECVLGMDPFQEKYDVIEKSPIVSDTEIVNSKVIFNVNWDLEIENKAGEVVSEVINHVTESDVKLKRVYELANRIIEKEMQDLKLEDITQDLIALEHPNVPVAGIELSCNKKEWQVNKVKESLLKMLRINIRELKVGGTSYTEFPEELTYYQNHYVWNIGDEYKYPEVNVIFNFDETYPHTFAVTPQSGNKMKSSQLGGYDILSFLCIQTWKFTYDVSYPVLVRVIDQTTGYTFNLAFTVHLVQNNPNRDSVTVAARPSNFVQTNTNEDFCNDNSVPMTVKTYELVENGQGVSYREDLGGVNISFSCLRYGCELGATEYDYSGQGFAGFTTNYPYCVGGILRGEKEGYLENWKRVTTSDNQNVELDLTPVIKVPQDMIKVVTHTVVDEELGLVSPAQELSNDETALIEIEFEQGNMTQNQIEHKVQLIKSKEMDEDFESEAEIELLANADFKYHVKINILKDEKDIVGGYEGEWIVPWQNLANANEITFHTIIKENLNEEEQFEIVFGLGEQSELVPQPSIK